MKKVIAKIITNAKPYLRNNPMFYLFFQMYVNIIIMNNIINMNMKSN
jgi:hypothetical protein